VVPELYRFWRQRGEAGWALLQRMADRALSRLGPPNAETIETLGHLSLAILHEHRERPEDMARLLAIWRELANRLISAPLFRLIGRRWVLSLLTSPLARLLARQPDYQPLNLRELAATFAKPVTERGAWTTVSDCLGRDDGSVEPVLNVLLEKSRPFDLFLMLSAERTLIAKGGYDIDRVFDATERVFREGAPLVPAISALCVVSLAAPGAGDRTGEAGELCGAHPRLRRARRRQPHHVGQDLRVRAASRLARGRVRPA